MKSLIVPALCGLSLLFSVSAQADATKDCHIGSYRLSDGQMLDIAPANGDMLRWRTFTGETGRLQQNKDGSWTNTVGPTQRPDARTVSFSDCSKGEVSFGKGDRKAHCLRCQRDDVRERGIKLVGRLVMPKGSGKG